MSLPPKIASAIPQQNFELIRDQIGAVLLVEFTNQAANYGLAANATPKDIWIEGFMQVDDDILPTFVIRCVKAIEIQKDSSGTAVYDYCYYIDGFSGAPSTDTERGDQVAAYALQRMFGVARAILEDPRYDILGFASNVMNIWNTHIEDWYIQLPKNNDDLEDAICGRIEFHVTVAEVPSSYSATNPVQWVDTTVQLINSGRGYHWVMKQQQINILATSATLTNSFFSNPIKEISLLDTGGNETITYQAITDFTQSGTTITATTFTFTNGTIILAKT